MESMPRNLQFRNAIWGMLVLLGLGFIGLMGWIGFVAVHDPHHPDTTRDALGTSGGILVGTIVAALVGWGMRKKGHSSRLLDPEAIAFLKQYSRHV